MGFTRVCSLLIAVVLLSSASVRAQDSQPVKRDLRFEVVKEPQSPRPSPVVTPSRVPPTHVAVFETPEPVKWLGKVNYSNLKNGIFHTPAGKSASPEQKAYQTQNFIRMDFPANRPYGGPISRIEISSPSEDDARKMVEAFLQWTDQAAAEERADKEASLKRAREWLAAAEKDLPELQPRLDAAKAERENLEKVIAYSGAEDATKDILELDKALRSVEIDLTVARAKQKAINNLLNTAQYPTGRELINQMLAAQDIELAGALARKSALEAERAKAVHYRDLVRQIEKDGKGLRELTSYRMEGGNKITPIVSQQQRIAELEAELAEIKPLAVAGDKVTIYRISRPVGVDSRPSGATVSDRRLDRPVNYATPKASVQDIVKSLTGQVGLKYDWERSFANTDPVCRQWVEGVNFRDKPCREALDQILAAVGLRYELEGDALVLYRDN